MTNEEIFNEFELVLDTLGTIVEEVEPIDKVVIKKAIELIECVNWKYEEDE